MRFKLFLPILMYIVSNLVPVDGQTGTQAKALYTQLFVTDAYNSRIRPVNDQSQPIAVSVDLILVTLNNVDSVEGTITTTGYLIVKWTDEFLQWTPSSYGNLQEYHWPQGDIWTPDIVPANTVDSFDGFGSGSNIVLNTYNGSITWAPYEILTSTCSMNVGQFPFDRQVCEIMFESWGYTTSQVTLTGGSIGFGLDHYTDHTDWEIVSRDVTKTTSEGHDVIIFRMEIERMPSYAVLTVLLPLIILSVLIVFTFLIPGSDKIGFAVSLLLTFGVFFGTISVILPQAIANLIIYLVVMTILSSITCIIAIVQTKLYEFDDLGRKVPKALHFLKKFKIKEKEEKKQPTIKVNKVEHSTDIGGKSEKRNGHFLPPVDDVDVESNEKKADNDDEEITWKDVLDGSDMFFFYTMGFVVFLITLISLLVVAT